MLSIDAHVMQSISKKIALLCLLLTFFSAAALVTHHHSGATDAVKCTVCVTAHASSPKAVSHSTEPDIRSRFSRPARSQFPPSNAW